MVSVQDGVEKGYIVGSNFYKAGDEKTEVSAVDITKQKKFYVVCVTGSAKIQTDGDPVCVRGRDLKREYGRDAERRDVLYYLQIKGSGGNPRILERRDLQFKIL